MKQIRGTSTSILFLRFDLIQPGDVLLTRSASREALAIAGATVGVTAALWGGGFSHAALWIPYRNEDVARVIPDHTGLLLAEADDFGVGITRLCLKSIKPANEAMNALVIPMFNTTQGKLLRHPKLKTLKLGAVLSASEWLQETEFFRAYSSLGRLADAAHFYPTFKPFLRSLLICREAVDDALVHGAFCSELVAKFFDRLQLPLFADNRPASSISPSDLDNSCLVEVDGAILSADNIDLDVDEVHSASDRAEYLPRMVRWKSDHIHLEKSITSLIETANRQSQQTLMAAIEINKDLILRIKAAIRSAAQWSDFGRINRLSLYNNDALMALYLRQELLRRTQHNQRSPSQGYSAVEMQINRIANTIIDKLQKDFIRTHILMVIGYFRILVRERVDPKCDETWFRSQREQQLHIWVNYRKRGTEIERLIAELYEVISADISDDVQQDIWQFIRSSISNANTPIGHSTDGPQASPVSKA
jgi:hypothetical protein